MSKVSYLNEVKERLVYRLAQEFKNEDLVKSIVDHHFDTLQQKLFPAPFVRLHTKEQLIHLFTVGETKAPYRLRYKTLGRERDQWKAHKPIFDELIREKFVRIGERTRNTILYLYDPQKFVNP